MRLVLLALACLTGPSIAYAQSCAPQPLHLTFDRGDGEARIDRSRSLKALTARAGRERRVVSRSTDDWLVGGLHSATLAKGVQARFVVSETSAGTCLHIVELRVSLHVKDAVIYIAHEIKPQTCLWNEVLAHEQEHWTINKEGARAARDETERAIGEWTDRANGILVTGGNPRPAMDRLQRAVWSIIEKGADIFTAKTEPLHLRHDSEEEYLRLSVVCDGAIQALVR